MFRSFIYLDEHKLYTYKRQIDGKNDVQPKAVSQKKTAGFSAAVSGFGLNGATETSIDGEFEKDVSFDYDRFELDLMVEIFDPLKDFIRLPRTMRRQMTANGKPVGLDKISIEGPVLKVEVIAIYK